MLLGQILAAVTGAGSSREKSDFLANGGFNAVRNCEAALFFD